MGAPSLGDAEFSHLNTFLASCASLRTAMVQFRQALSEVLKELRSIIAWAKAIPVITIKLSEDVAGSDVRRALSGRRNLIPKRFAVSTLVLPETAERYLQGRSRQAVRTNRNRALRNGFTAAEVKDRREIRSHLSGLSTYGIDRPTKQWLDSRLLRNNGRFWFILAPDLTAVAVASVSVDRGVARLNIVWVMKHQLESDLRFLLSSQIFMDLSDEGLRYVFADTALFARPGIVYLQQRLGFSLCTLRFS